MAENPQELSLDKAKNNITSATDSKAELKAVQDLVGKKFDELTTDNISKLGKTSEGTVVLLHALANRYGS